MFGSGFPQLTVWRVSARDTRTRGVELPPWLIGNFALSLLVGKVVKGERSVVLRFPPLNINKLRFECFLSSPYPRVILGNLTLLRLGFYKKLRNHVLWPFGDLTLISLLTISEVASALLPHLLLKSLELDLPACTLPEGLVVLQVGLIFLPIGQPLLKLSGLRLTLPQVGRMALRSHVAYKIVQVQFFAIVLVLGRPVVMSVDGRYTLFLVAGGGHVLHFGSVGPLAFNHLHLFAICPGLLGRSALYFLLFGSITRKGQPGRTFGEGVVCAKAQQIFYFQLHFLPIILI